MSQAQELRDVANEVDRIARGLGARPDPKQFEALKKAKQVLYAVAAMNDEVEERMEASYV